MRVSLVNIKEFLFCGQFDDWSFRPAPIDPSDISTDVRLPWCELVEPRARIGPRHFVLPTTTRLEGNFFFLIGNCTDNNASV